MCYVVIKKTGFVCQWLWNWRSPKQELSQLELTEQFPEIAENLLRSKVLSAITWEMSEIYNSWYFFIKWVGGWQEERGLLGLILLCHQYNIDNRESKSIVLKKKNYTSLEEQIVCYIFSLLNFVVLGKMPSKTPSQQWKALSSSQLSHWKSSHWQSPCIAQCWRQNDRNKRENVIQVLYVDTPRCCMKWFCKV